MKDKAAEPNRLWIFSFAPVFMLLISLGFMNNALFGSDYYPPRVSKIDGTAAYEPAGEVDWEELAINLPLLSGDRIYSHVDSRIEVDFGQANFLRLGEETDVAFSKLEEKETALELHSGSMILRINRDHRFQIYTPDGLVSIKKDGLYRIDATEARPTEVIVRKGEAKVESSVGRAEIDSGERMVLAPGPSGNLEVTYGYYEDSLDNWSDRRDASYVSSASVAYVGNTYYPGVWDLDYYGSWDYYPGYGRVWIPRVSVGWVPFRYGRWTYLPHYGYTWVSYDPWGWVPFHYGSWLYWGSRWCWLPGHFSMWTAAPVDFFYGGGYVGWYPRGYYGYGRGGTTIINNNTVIVNNNGHTPGPGRRGLTVVRQSDFRYGRSVNRVAENIQNQRSVQWRSGLPSGASNSFREGRQAVARSDRFAVASAGSGTPRATGRRISSGDRATPAAAQRFTEGRQSATTQRSIRNSDRAAQPGRSTTRSTQPARSIERSAPPARSTRGTERPTQPSRSIQRSTPPSRGIQRSSPPNRGIERTQPQPDRRPERAAPPARSMERSEPPKSISSSSRVAPSSNRDRSRISVIGGRGSSGDNVRTYSIGERTPSSVRLSREQAIERARSEVRSGSGTRTVRVTPSAPSSRVAPPTQRDSSRGSLPRVERRSVPERPSVSPNFGSRPPTSMRTAPATGSRPRISQPSMSRPSISRPSISRPSFSRPSFSRPSSSRPSFQRPSGSSSRPSSGRSSSGARTRPNRH